MARKRPTAPFHRTPRRQSRRTPVPGTCRSVRSSVGWQWLDDRAACAHRYTERVSTAISSPVKRSRSPVALWHLLSLDAPSVAVLWTAFLARLNVGRVPARALLALALAVWMIYVADRILDGGSDSGDLEERHRFHQRHRSTLLVVFALALPVLAALVWTLPWPLRVAWPLLGVPLAIYAGAVHSLRLRRLPKEILVSGIFTVACSLPAALSHPLGLRMVAQAAIFACLCWLNSTAIVRWEMDGSDPRRMGTELASRGPHTSLLLSSLVFAALSLSFPAVGIAALLAVAALFWLDREPSLSRLHRRSLADAALLTPLLVWPWLGFLGKL